MDAPPAMLRPSYGYEFGKILAGDLGPHFVSSPVEDDVVDCGLSTNSRHSESSLSQLAYVPDKKLNSFQLSLKSLFLLGGALLDIMRFLSIFRLSSLEMHLLKIGND